ncbi:glycosyltransferase [Parapedobacter koreensis]|uniref:Phosphoheptose isomerase n=1 Tax=Parapedobacter koreensis TaxID=332977 RepID=A0A1H7P118_9SPHI|nr:glycosyltransferase [Parapedobacter koreensis]SEL28988.1 phosphoheptose isomerase [Parapedobacter koreensis]
MNKTIALISEHASPLAMLGGVDSGGQNIYVGELARQLATLGYTVDVFTRRDDPKLPIEVQWLPDVRIVHIEAGPPKQLPKETLFQYMDAFTESMEAFMTRQPKRYTLLHANFWMSGYVAMKLKERLGIPFVVTFHALGKVRLMHQRETDKFPVERCDVESQIMQAADGIIAECPQDEADLIQLYQADADKITMVPCGFSPHEFHPIDKAYARMLLDLHPTRKIILQLGRMVPRKGIDTVIQALAQLRGSAIDAQLVIVGGEYEKPHLHADVEYRRLMEMASVLDVADAISFEGRKNREQLKYFYSAADVFVSTPWYEPFGITPLEAMACGTPVIGAKVGGIQYSVANGKTGFLVRPKDPEALARKLELVLKNDDLRIYMQHNAIKRVNECFTWKKVAQQMDEVYRGLTAAQLDNANDDKQVIAGAFQEAADIFRLSADSLTDTVLRAGKMLAKTFAKGGKVLVCGNGGSAAESLHFSAELLGRFELPNRVGLPVISLMADAAMLTAWSNDVGFDDIFAREVEAYGRPGDVLMCLSTSGNSPNILEAMDKAKQLGMVCVALLGNDGGRAAAKGDINLVVPSSSTQRIQELHLHIIHLLCTIVEQKLEDYSAKHQASGLSSLIQAVDLPYQQNGKAKHHAKQKSHIFG